MNVTHIPEMVEMLLVVNVAALLLLAVLAYVSSRWALDGLESFDRWLSKPKAKARPEPDAD